MICERLQIVYVVLLHVVLRSPCAFFTMVRFSFLQVGSNRAAAAVPQVVQFPLEMKKTSFAFTRK